MFGRAGGAAPNLTTRSPRRSRSWFDIAAPIHRWRSLGFKVYKEFL